MTQGRPAEPTEMALRVWGMTGGKDAANLRVGFVRVECVGRALKPGKWDAEEYRERAGVGLACGEGLLSEFRARGGGGGDGTYGTRPCRRRLFRRGRMSLAGCGSGIGFGRKSKRRGEGERTPLKAL